MVEEADGCTIYRLSDVEYIQSVENYCDELKQQGYTDQPPYEIDTWGDNLVNQWLYKADMGDESYIVVISTGVETLVIKSAEECPYREAYLWDQLSVSPYFGMGYLRYVTVGFIYVDGTLGSGTGYSTDGYIWRNTYRGTMESFNKTIAALNKAGFDTEYGHIEEGDYHEYAFSRTDEFTYDSCTIYVKVILDGTYLEVEFGYGINEGSHKEG